MKLWIIGVAIVLFVYLAAIALGMLADFADVPCQDGVWYILHTKFRIHSCRCGESALLVACKKPGQAWR